jgi:hypothetical protein
MQLVNLGKMDYDGSQLRHAFAYEKAKVLGATITIFRGAANVKDHLVDLEDAFADDFIKSANMWHFIIEIPATTIMAAVALQRLFICQCIDRLREINPDVIYDRNGDDILIAGKKLSVSIATLSRFSALIHVGINITVGEDCPVEAIGLSDLIMGKSVKNLEKAINIFGTGVAQNFIEEYEDIKNATYKVREV